MLDTIAELEGAEVLDSGRVAVCCFGCKVVLLEAEDFEVVVVVDEEVLEVELEEEEGF